MKVITPEANIIVKDGNTPYQFIERIGRTCYKSTDKITDDSAVKFVKGLAKSKHYAMLEHYWVHIMIDECEPEDVRFDLEHLLKSSLVNSHGGMTDVDKFIQVTSFKNLFISAPLRVFLEFDNLFTEDDLVIQKFSTKYKRVNEIMAAVAEKFPELFDTNRWKKNYDHVYVMEEDEFCDNLVNDMVITNPEVICKEQMKHRTHTVLFICDRGVSHEFVRHRVASFAQESTRYCNYTKDKFGNEITVIEPFFFGIGSDVGGRDTNLLYTYWYNSCRISEEYYNKLIDRGATPQEARAVLPNSLKTELIITANDVEWQHIIDLRYDGVTGAPHPQIKEVMGLVVKNLIIRSKGRLHSYEADKEVDEKSEDVPFKASH